MVRAVSPSPSTTRQQHTDSHKHTPNRCTPLAFLEVKNGSGPFELVNRLVSNTHGWQVSKRLMPSF